MFRSSFIAISSLFLAAASLGLSAPAPQKRTVGIANFTWEAVHADWYRVFGSEEQIGRSIRSRLTTRLTQGKQVTIVEREELQRLIDEQNRTMSDRFRAGQGPRASRLSGADAYLLGAITIFGHDDSRQHSFGHLSVPGLRVLPDIRINRTKVVVAIDYRLVDSETGEILDAGEARGESERVSRSLGDAIKIPGVGAVGGNSMESSHFERTIIGEATMNCVEKLAVMINGKTLAMAPRRAAEVAARVAKVDGHVVRINAGSSKGVQVGQQFALEANGGAIKDPETGRVIGYDSHLIGTLTITAVNSSEMSTGTFTPGLPGASPKVGDLAHTE